MLSARQANQTADRVIQVAGPLMPDSEEGTGLYTGVPAGPSAVGRYSLSGHRQDAHLVGAAADPAQRALRENHEVSG